METNTHQKGRAGERLALDYFTKLGFVCLAANFRSKGGELDLVMREPVSGTIVFIEVRSSLKPSAWLRHSIGSVKQRRLRQGIQWFFWKHPHLRNSPFRFDMVWVERENSKIEHWKNVGLSM